MQGEEPLPQRKPGPANDAMAQKQARPHVLPVLSEGKSERVRVAGPVRDGPPTYQGLLPPVPLPAQRQGVPGPVPVTGPERADASGESAGEVCRGPHLHLRGIHTHSAQPLQVLPHLQPQVCEAVPEQATGAKPAATHLRSRRHGIPLHVEGQEESVYSD